MAMAQEVQQRAEVACIIGHNNIVHNSPRMYNIVLNCTTQHCINQAVSSSSSSCSEEAITDIPDIIVDPVEDREVSPGKKEKTTSTSNGATS